jgi:hypothetical protein
MIEMWVLQREGRSSLQGDADRKSQLRQMCDGVVRSVEILIEEASLPEKVILSMLYYVRCTLRSGIIATDSQMSLLAAVLVCLELALEFHASGPCMPLAAATAAIPTEEYHTVQVAIKEMLGKRIRHGLCVFWQILQESVRMQNRAAASGDCLASLGSFLSLRRDTDAEVMAASSA